MTKKIGYLLPVTFLALICVFAWQMKALAYFDQGPVGVSVGRQSITLEEGQSGNVSLTFTPASSSQLPGCGMAECPQTCGEKECLDENGQCTCNGETYQTYYAYAVVTSSNTSVATAEYDDNGVVVISAVSPGTASIKVTASLRQFTSTSATIAVTVEAAKASGNTPSETTPSPQPTNSAGVTPPVTVTQITGNNGGDDSGKNTPSAPPAATGGQDAPSAPSAATGGQDAPSAPSAATGGQDIPGAPPEGSDGQDAPGVSREETDGEDAPDASGQAYTVIESVRGPIYFVPITEGEIGEEVFAEIIGKEAYVDFQKKDAAENIMYAWEFYGADLTGTGSVDLTLDTGATAFSGCPYCSPSDTLYISFAQDGSLPAQASLYLQVSEYFDDGDELNLYSYEDGRLGLVAEGIGVENGYAAMTLAAKSNLILTTEDLTSAIAADENESGAEDGTEESAASQSAAERGGVSPVLAAVLVVVGVLIVAAAAVIVIVFRRGKNRKGHTDD